MNTIYILWLRQLKRYFRSRSRIIGSLAQPVLFLLAFGFGFGSIYQRAGEGNYLEFLAPGIILMSVLFTAVFNGIEVIWDKQFGFLKETLVAPVSRINIMLGRTLGGATVATLQGLIVFFLTLLFGFRPENFPMVIIGFILIFLAALLFTSLGTLIATLMDDMQGFQLVINFLIMPTFFLSGALFPLRDLPPVMQNLVRLNPLTYGVDGVRMAFIGSGTFPLFLDFGILAIITFIILAIGTYTFNHLQA